MKTVQLTTEGLQQIQSIREGIAWKLNKDTLDLQEEKLDDVIDRNNGNKTSNETFERMNELKDSINEHQITLKILDRQIELSIEFTKN